MKKTLFLMMMTTLALTACQNDKAPAVKAPAEPAAVANITQDAANAPVQTDQKQAVSVTDNAVAVTKPAESSTAQSMQAALHQAKVNPAYKPVVATKAIAAPKPTVPAMPVVAAGDAIKGKSIARKCKACHNFTTKNKVGPGLKGVFGRKAGTAPGMRYSPALTAGGWIWNEKNLALWVCDSKNAVKMLSGNPSVKTKMGAQHICDAGKQANLIAYLKTL